MYDLVNSLFSPTELTHSKTHDNGNFIYATSDSYDSGTYTEDLTLEHNHWLVRCDESKIDYVWAIIRHLTRENKLTPIASCTTKRWFTTSKKELYEIKIFLGVGCKPDRIAELTSILASNGVMDSLES